MKKRNDEMDRSEYLIRHKEEVSLYTFCRVFSDTARAYPDRTAVCADGRSVTYKELLQWSEAAAHRLLNARVEQEEIVAVKTGRTIETIASILGIWKAGAAYVYLDAAYPAEREHNIIQECGCRFILDEKWWKGLDRQTAYPELDHSKRDGLALLIYTSGSTSRPKGVMLEHKNVTACMFGFDIFGTKKEEHFGVFPGLSFVASVSDIFSSLAVGSAVYIIPREIRKDIRALIRYYKENEIRITFLPPHMARKLLAEDLTGIPLRLLLVGSEAVRNLGKAPFRIFNVYGASELCAMISHYEIHELLADVNCPVGKLNPGLKGYLVSDEGIPVKKGEEGELWLAGNQVSRGYFKLQEATASHYIKNPFTDEPEYARVFKTNDILRELEDGNLQYICRKDNVFKIRGFRVESTAVEHAIMECASVREVVVKSFTDEGGCNILCGYFTADEKLDAKVIKERLKEKIPYYMVPTCLIQLSAFPLNLNSKIDRRAIEPPKELNDHKLLEKLY